MSDVDHLVVGLRDLPAVWPIVITGGLALLVCVAALVVTGRRALALTRRSEQSPKGTRLSRWPELACGLSLVSVVVAIAAVVEGARAAARAALAAETISDHGKLTTECILAQAHGLTTGALVLLVLGPLVALAAAWSSIVRRRAQQLLGQRAGLQPDGPAPRGPATVLALGIAGSVALASWPALVGVVVYGLDLVRQVSVLGACDPAERPRMAARGIVFADSILTKWFGWGAVGLAVAAALALTALALGFVLRRRRPLKVGRPADCSVRRTLVLTGATLALAAACLLAAQPYAAERELAPPAMKRAANLLLSPAVARSLPALHGPDEPTAGTLLTLSDEGMSLGVVDVTDLADLRRQLRRLFGPENAKANRWLGVDDPALSVAVAKSVPLSRLLEVLGEARAVGIELVYLLCTERVTQLRPILGRQVLTRIGGVKLLLVGEDGLGLQSVGVAIGDSLGAKARMSDLPAATPIALVAANAMASAADLAEIGSLARRAGHPVQLLVQH